MVGGGNVAIDVARTAARLGSEHVEMFCLESSEAVSYTHLFVAPLLQHEFVAE